jgi:hypothetical protein
MSLFCFHKWVATDDVILTKRQPCWPNGDPKAGFEPRVTAISAVRECEKCGKVRSFKL